METIQAIDSRAKKTGRSKSAIAQEALDHYFAPAARKPRGGNHRKGARV